MKQEEQMLISAVRYALGRKSCIVSDTCRIVASVKDKLSKRCIEILIHEIEEEIEWHHELGRTCGMECDESLWLKLLEVLKEKAV